MTFQIVDILSTVNLTELDSPHKLSQWIIHLPSLKPKKEQNDTDILVCNDLSSFIYSEQINGSVLRNDFTKADFEDMMQAVFYIYNTNNKYQNYDDDWIWKRIQIAKNPKDSTNNKLLWINSQWTKYQLIYDNMIHITTNNSNNNLKTSGTSHNRINNRLSAKHPLYDIDQKKANDNDIDNIPSLSLIHKPKSLTHIRKKPSVHATPSCLNLFKKVRGPDTGGSDADDTIKRILWSVGSSVLVYSRSKKDWYYGEIVGIINNKDHGTGPNGEDTEWLIVQYDKGRCKRIQRSCKQIKPFADNDVLSLQVGSQCLIHSDKNDIWFDGKILKIFTDDEGEWLQVMYTEEKQNKTCEIQRYSKHLKCK